VLVGILLGHLRRHRRLRVTLVIERGEDIDTPTPRGDTPPEQYDP